MLENEASGAQPIDAAHWVSVYGNLLALLARGARVSIGERRSGDLVAVDPEEVSERLLFWRAQVS